MKFRNIVLLVAVVSSLEFVRSATRFYVSSKIAWQSDRAFGLLAVLIQALFLCILYAEASEWIKAKARAVIAFVLSILLVLDGGGSTLNVASKILAGSDSMIHIPEVFRWIWLSLWIAFLITCSSTRVTGTSRFAPKVAGVFALYIFFCAVWGSLMLHTAHVTLLSWNHARFLSWSAAMFLFFVAIWRRWKRDLPIHENIVCLSSELASTP